MLCMGVVAAEATAAAAEAAHVFAVEDEDVEGGGVKAAEVLAFMTGYWDCCGGLLNDCDWDDCGGGCRLA